ncbi:MAG TPA: response regulator [Candidatus Kapabacteria bacterium]|jgi:CheY-like chemotaxis protein|nr:response regulator [Candidatus Kapabacteria bacterium]HOV92974.1 response regulator [Candidatus Kapabacteria bacterium]
MAEYSVLIVDDDIWMQRILAKSVQSYGFQTVFFANNGYDGIALAVEKHPDLIILDILMPELSGLQTLRVLKTIKITKNIPVLVVSALSDTENLALAVRNGSSGFISKPFTRATIYDKLIEVFGKEKLLQIAKGDETGKAMENITMIQESTEQNIPPKPPSKEEKSPQISPEAARANREELLEHYQSDEKKTLDSIKKLLLKNKK